MNGATQKLNERLVISAFKIIEAWQEWLDAAEVSVPRKVFHIFCIRVGKGVVKARRILLAELSLFADQPENEAMSQATERLNGHLVISGYKIIEAWREWLDDAEISDSRRTFHVSCIQLSKRIVRARRVLLDELKTPNQESKLAGQPASLSQHEE